MLPFPFPNLESCDVFPLPEGTNLEFKIGFNSSMADKIIATLCGILNSGGGYLVIGVEDETRKIVGIKPNKNMDNFLLMLDAIYHHSHIKKIDGSPITIGTITSKIIDCAENKQVLVVIADAEPKEQYTIKDGTIWYRLSASNFKQTTLQTIYTEKEVDTILKQKLSSQANILHQQFDMERKALNQKFKYDHEKLKVKFMELENDFKKMIGAAKEADAELIEFRDKIFSNILLQKSIAEKNLEKNNYDEKKDMILSIKSWLSYLCGCI